MFITPCYSASPCDSRGDISIGTFIRNDISLSFRSPLDMIHRRPHYTIRSYFLISGHASGCRLPEPMPPGRPMIGFDRRAMTVLVTPWPRYRFLDIGFIGVIGICSWRAFSPGHIYGEIYARPAGRRSHAIPRVPPVKLYAIYCRSLIISRFASLFLFRHFIIDIIHIIVEGYDERIYNFLCAVWWRHQPRRRHFLPELFACEIFIYFLRRASFIDL